MDCTSERDTIRDTISKKQRTGPGGRLESDPTKFSAAQGCLRGRAVAGRKEVCERAA